MTILRLKKAFFIIALFSLFACGHNKPTKMRNKYNDTTWFTIPVAKVIYPFDSLYKYDSENEKTEFLIFQINRENKCIEPLPIHDDVYRKCPTLNEENSYSTHISKDYITHILCFAESERDFPICELAIKELSGELNVLKKSFYGQYQLYPLLGKNENTIFRGYILAQESYEKYAEKFNLKEFKKDLYYNSRGLGSELLVDSLNYSIHNIMLLGLSRSFELNPDVLKVVDLPLIECE